MKKLFNSFYVKVLFLALVIPLSMGFYTYYDGGGSQHPKRFMTSTAPVSRTDSIFEEDSPFAIDLDYTHHQMHKGNSYKVCGLTTLGSGDYKETIIYSPANPDVQAPHITFRVSAEALTQVFLLEGATATSALQRMPMNRKRSSSNTSNTQVFDVGGVSSSAGTLLEVDSFGSSPFGAATGEERDEFILARDTIYVLAISSLATGNTLSWCLNFYEPDQIP